MGRRHRKSHRCRGALSQSRFLLARTHIFSPTLAGVTKRYQVKKRSSLRSSRSSSSQPSFPFSYSVHVPTCHFSPRTGLLRAYVQVLCTKDLFAFSAETVACDLSGHLNVALLLAKHLQPLYPALEYQYRYLLHTNLRAAGCISEVRHSELRSTTGRDGV